VKGQEDWAFWLMMTNLGLALIVVAAVATVIAGMTREFLAAGAQRAREVRGVGRELSALLVEESHRRLVPDLGLTMADGGEEIGASHQEPRDKK
jgi:hypothetical protein